MHKILSILKVCWRIVRLHLPLPTKSAIKSGVTYYFRKSVDIGYFGYGNNIGSDFLVRQTMEVLKARGWRIEDNCLNAKIILIRNTENKEVYRLCEAAKRKGCKIIFYKAEPSHPIEDENSLPVKCWGLADLFILNSVGYKVHPNFRFWSHNYKVICESFPNDFDTSLSKLHTKTSDPMLVWHGFSHRMIHSIYGLSDKYDNLKRRGELLPYPFLGNLKEQLPARLITISQEYKGARRRFSGVLPDIIHPGYPKLFSELLKFDVGIGPHELWSTNSHTKPVNKLAMYMLVGLPVICVGIPEYRRWINHGETGYVANSIQEWIEGVEFFRDWRNREAVGAAGRDIALTNFAPSKIADEWEDALQCL